MEVEKRIRLKFEDGILSETQASDGLIRSWILLKPHQHDTVSDVVAHLLHAFELHQSCPDGLLLAISGFLLPPFESSSILKENEVIRVKKRRVILSLEGNNDANETEQLEAVRTRPVNTGDLLLASEEFEKEKGGYENDDPGEESENKAEEEILEDIENPLWGNTDSKHRKRKAAEKLKGPKKKRRHSEATGSDANIEMENTDQGGRTKKKRLSSEKRNNAEHNAENDEETARSCHQNYVSELETKRSNEDEEKEETEDTKMSLKETKKGPSRSARRKYAKRRWLKEMKKIQMQNLNCESEGLRNWKEDKAKAEWNKPKWKKPVDTKKNDDGQPKGLLHWKQSAQDDHFVKGKKLEKRNKKDYNNKHQNQNNDWHKRQNDKSVLEQPTGNNPDQPEQNEGNVQEQPNRNIGGAQELLSQNHNASEQPNEESNKEDEVVPIVIRPGHIRFGDFGEEQAVEKSYVPSETLQWNGITSKKKGQQWGIENNPRNEAKKSKKAHSEILSNDKEEKLYGGIDLEKLPPFTSIPKEGDFIAYRLLELSSSWTPELSALRVGQVSWYNDASNRIKLMPVPEYPIVSDDENEGEDGAAEMNSTFYKEDGSLEIEFSSLIDARTLSNGILAPGNESLDKESENLVGNESTSEIVLPASNNAQTETPCTDNVTMVETRESNQGKETEPPTTGYDLTQIWDQVTETINAKKEQLAKENGRDKTPKNVQNAKTAASMDSGGGKQSSGKSWSYKALRSSGLGPTMAILRSK